jgi:chromate transport protein ChrA
MILTLLTACCLIILGLGGFLGWDRLGTEGNQVEMLMPVFFGGALIICIAFGRQHYRHGLYGGLIIAVLGIVSALVRIYQYEQFQSFSDPKTQLVIAMAVICTLQISISWREVQKDRAKLLSIANADE